MQPNKRKKHISMFIKQFDDVNDEMCDKINVLKKNDALDLKAYSRLQCTNHVFLAQVRELINSRNFFKVSAGPGLVDRKLRRGIELLNSDREKICSWSPEEVASNVFFAPYIAKHEAKRHN